MLSAAGRREPPPASAGDALRALLRDLEALGRARDAAGALRALVEAACRSTSSRQGLAGLCDGRWAEADEWLDGDAGWRRERRRWALGRGAVGGVCLTAAPLVRAAGTSSGAATDDDASPVERPSACVPLLLPGGAVIGFVQVGGRAADFTTDDVRVLATLARLGTTHLREVIDAGGRSIEECAAQTDVAQRLQRRLLPATAPELPDVDVAFRYHSASTGVLSGGDFVDYYLRPPSSSLAFAIGDVSGRGVDAMATTFVTKYTLRAAVLGGQLSWPVNPGEALQELRTSLLEEPDFDPEAERFVTVLCGQLTPRRGSLLLASAGHPTPFLVREAEVERPLLVTEPAIGVELGAALAPYPTESLELARGDVLVMFTDGIAELRDAGGRFFEDEMGGLLARDHDVPASKVLDDLLDAARGFSAGSSGDDLALLAVRLTAEPEVH